MWKRAAIYNTRSWLDRHNTHTPKQKKLCVCVWIHICNSGNEYFFFLMRRYRATSFQTGGRNRKWELMNPHKPRFATRRQGSSKRRDFGYPIQPSRNNGYTRAGIIQHVANVTPLLIASYPRLFFSNVYLALPPVVSSPLCILPLFSVFYAFLFLFFSISLHFLSLSVSCPLPNSFSVQVCKNTKYMACLHICPYRPTCIFFVYVVGFSVSHPHLRRREIR